MGYRIVFKSSVVRDLKRLDKRMAEMVLRQLKETLGQNPNAGEPLAGEFKGLHKLRVGDYRVVYAKTSDALVILRVGHRSKVY